MTISILYPNQANPLIVPVGELIGCFNAWTSVFKPHLDWKTSCIPKFAEAATLQNLLIKEPRRIFGIDTIVRLIAGSHIPNIENTMQATGEFSTVNSQYLIACQRPGLIMKDIGGLGLSQNALNSWYNYNRNERLRYCAFGFDRMQSILVASGIDIDSLVYPSKFFE